ncbi:hypothetical protein [Microbacterium sp.]|uniref:hypothetical protein n=1 Tax=Microbacterium sp. TaxID=51671 RepID=UPI002E333C87|nr:hypothetical protein [Microbacterium sp.]HEX5730947.1 hypothetical protein [Microbacterium sp.]
MTRALLLSVTFLLGCMEEQVGADLQPICDCVRNPHSCCCTTPIVLDLEGDGIRLTSWEKGVVFSLVPPRGPGWRAWTEKGSDDAFLGRDHTGDGVVNDGFELFGDVTPQDAPSLGESYNGFRALAEYDENADGLIDAADAVYTELILWQDRNHDGVSTLNEISGLAEHGITGLSVVYDEPNRPDEHGNLYRFSAAVLAAPGSKVAPRAWDVSLTSPTRAERRAASLPDPVPASDEPPVSQPNAFAPPAAASAGDCFITMQVARPLYNDIGSGTVKTRAQWYQTSGTPSDCPSSTNPTTVRLYQYRLGQWRLLINTNGAMGPLMWKDAPKVCRFRGDSAWVGEADFIFTESPFQSLSRYERRGSDWIWPCSEYPGDSDLPPCEQEP